MLSLSIPVLLFASFFSFSLPVGGTSILLPLYSYPETSSTWSPLFSALSAHPTVSFTVIINPDSGPGSGTYPDSSYAAGLEQLHSYPNALVIGYEHTSYGDVPLSTIQTTTTTYAGWSSYTGGNITVQGIFLDEAPNDDSTESLGYMHNASAIVRDTIPAPSGSAESFVVFNPGAVTPADYLEAVPPTGADGVPNLIVQYEDTWAKYKGASTISTFQGDLTKSALIVNEVPSGTDVSSAVTQAANAGVGAVYFTTDGDYRDLGLLDEIATALESSSG